MEARIGSCRLILGDYRDVSARFDSVATDPPFPGALPVLECPFLSLGKFHILKGTKTAHCEISTHEGPIHIDWIGGEDLTHSIQKPVGLMKWCVRRLPGIVFDPFMGTGTTGLACLDLGREFIGVEIDRKTFDIACERTWHRFNRS